MMKQSRAFSGKGVHHLLNNGFTLIEVLIVVVIIGIIAAIGTLQMQNTLGRIRVEEQTKQMYADIMSARSRAVSRSRIHFVKIDTAPLNRYRIWEDTNPGPDGDTKLQEASDALFLQTTVPYNLYGTTNSFYFDSQGLAHGIGSIRLENSHTPLTDCITISLTRVRMGRWNSGTPPKCDAQ